jgi:hypothetical protein
VRPPQADAACATRDVADSHAAVARRLTLEEVQIERAVRTDLEAIRGEPRDRQVAPDPAALIEQQAVDDGADRPVDAVRREVVEVRGRPVALDGDPLERRDVVERDAVAGCARFGAHDRVPVPRCPRVPSRDVVPPEQGLVHPIPVRPFPPTALQEVRPELAFALVERRGPQRPRLLHRLERMDDVVDLDVVLDAPVMDERRRQLMRFEAVDVAFMQVGRGAAVDEPLGHRATDAQGMGHPYGLGDPEAADVRRLAHQGEAVGREREDPVDPAFDPCVRCA